MQQGPAIIASKLANALIPDARPTVPAQVLSGGVLKYFSKYYGGLWVGGTVTLTPHDVRFAANGMNRALHKNLSDITIPLDRVVEASDRFGVVTRIVDVRSDGGSVLTFRCFGANALARQIADAARAAKAGQSL